uniref:Putative LAGLIDADG homing endonuclease n=1 Tax=Tetraselmis sp. CCMP 881 TaxID=1812852 RepID=A0A650ARD2_9CHLO|nr:putative LAGLIDADG homing endonuclease [Tetraselmis sp. CCMP 881]
MLILWGQSAGNQRKIIFQVGSSETKRLEISIKNKKVNRMNLQSQWIVGFTDGEGCFHTSIVKVNDMKLGLRPIPEFTIVQHERNIQVLYALKRFFGCGIVKINHGKRYSFCVRNIEHLKEKILPFFEKHKLKTRKRQEFIIFRRIILSMHNKNHLTGDGLKQIHKWSDALKKLKKIEI